MGPVIVTGDRGSGALCHRGRQATDAGVLSAGEASDWLAGLEQAAADGCFFLSVNMIGVVGSTPRQ